MKALILTILSLAILTSTSCETTGGSSVPAGTHISGTTLAGGVRTNALGGSLFVGPLIEDVKATK